MNPSRILVVEDNPKNLKLVRDVLTYSGFEVIEATCGEDGVRLAGQEVPDLILMDLQLPGIDGIEALRQIREVERTHVPVVAVTAFAMSEGTGQGRILVVEDNPKNLKLVRDVLTHFGYEVIEATSGEDGVRLAHEWSPDLILMDLQLPGIDGAEALRRIRDGDHRQVPVVAVTAFAMNDDRRRAFESGFDGYVEKPISVRALPQQISDFLKLGGTA